MLPIAPKYWNVKPILLNCTERTPSALFRREYLRGWLMPTRSERVKSAPMMIMRGGCTLDPRQARLAAKTTRGENVTREFKLRYDGKILSKKNRHVVARIGGRNAVLPDHAAQANENEIIAQFTRQISQSDQRDKIWQDKARRVLEAERVGATYEIGIQIWQSDGIRRDLDNQCSTLMDALVRSGAIPDDCRKFVKAIVIRDEGIDIDNPGAEITIRETRNK